MAKKNGDRRRSITNDQSGLVACQIEPGMFRGEYLVFLEVVDPQDLNQKVRTQLLVDQREVSRIQGTPKRNKPADALLRVFVIDKQGKFIRVVLPQPSPRVGDSVLVEEGLVRQEAGA